MSYHSFPISSMFIPALYEKAQAPSYPIPHNSAVSHHANKGGKGRFPSIPCADLWQWPYSRLSSDQLRPLLIAQHNANDAAIPQNCLSMKDQALQFDMRIECQRPALVNILCFI